MSGVRFGIVLGRFQPLHLGHVEYLEAAKRNCSRLVVGITNPDIQDLRMHHADPKRSDPESNPFSYFARYEMLSAGMRELGWSCDDFAIVPADISNMEIASKFLPVPSESTVYVTVYDEWGEEKASRFKDLGYAVVVLWRRSMSERLTSGTAIRECFRNDKPWRHLVPKVVAPLVDRYTIEVSKPGVASPSIQRSQRE